MLKLVIIIIFSQHLNVHASEETDERGSVSHAEQQPAVGNSSPEDSETSEKFCKPKGRMARRRSASSARASPISKKKMTNLSTPIPTSLKVTSLKVTPPPETVDFQFLLDLVDQRVYSQADVAVPHFKLTFK